VKHPLSLDLPIATGPSRVPGSVKNFFKGDFALEAVTYDLNTGATVVAANMGLAIFKRSNTTTHLVEAEVTLPTSGSEPNTVVMLNFAANTQTTADTSSSEDANDNVGFITAKVGKKTEKSEKATAVLETDETEAAAVAGFNRVAQFAFEPIRFGNTTRGSISSQTPFFQELIARLNKAQAQIADEKIHYQFDIITPDHFVLTFTLPKSGFTYTIYGNRSVPELSLWARYGTFTLLLILVGFNFYVNRKARQPLSNNGEPLRFKSERFGPRQAKNALEAAGSGSAASAAAPAASRGQNKAKAE